MAEAGPGGGGGGGPGRLREAGGSGRPGPGPSTWCLHRLGTESRGERLELSPGGEVTVGRGFGVTHRLLARNCPLMISRNHCSFRLTSEGQCTVVDNQSLNGVWVNGERIEPHLPFPLTEGDVIQLGVPLENKGRAEYEYRLAQCEKVPPPTVEEPGTGSSSRNAEGGRVKRKHSCEEAEHGAAEGPSTWKSKIQRVCESHPSRSGTSRERQSDMAEREDPGSGTSRERQSDTAEREDPGTSRERAASPHTPISGRLRTVSLAQGQSAQELAMLWRENWQIQELSARVRGLERQREPEQEERELRQLKERLCSEQEQQVDRSFHEDQRQLQHQDLEVALSRQRTELEDIIRAKDRELEEIKVKAQRDEAVAQLTDVLENELQCIICSEHFIEAVTLNCSHSFCSHCILEWRKRKDECPICRQTIQSQARSVVLDNCIERMVESLSESVRRRRVQLLKARKAMKTDPVPAIDSESSSCDDLGSLQSISTVGSSDIENSELEERSEEGETEEDPMYYII